MTTATLQKHSPARLYAAITVSMLAFLAILTVFTLIENVRFFKSESSIAFPELKDPNLPSIDRTNLTLIMNAINAPSGSGGVSNTQPSRELPSGTPPPPNESAASETATPTSTIEKTTPKK